MTLSRRAGAAFKRAVVFACAVAAVLVLLLGAVALAIAALFIWLAHETGPAEAAALAAAALLVLALAAGLGSWALLRRTRPQEPGLLVQTADMTATALRLVTLFVRKDPRKALITSLVAGALAAYLGREGRRKD